MYTPNLTGTSPSTTQNIVFYSNENISEKIEKAEKSTEYRESKTQESPSFLITFADGTTENLTDYIIETTKHWVKYFDTNGIPRYMVDEKGIFLNRLDWHLIT
ncbi:hypothetical protein R6242_22100 [Iodobacter sp. CM08]|uniref:hypothetical protein n=1 Tax=Iodobacter sp. CM08 TaxID=3085902 RepID=UPI00298122C4|nr:hypothetical protein [Iodobacter sp. CM08]MDW5419269.1 hypothetical protein [Iodobacter sp. CM08]